MKESRRNRRYIRKESRRNRRVLGRNQGEIRDY